MSSACRRSRGTSLIEAIVVLALVGILAQLTVPSFVSWRRRAELRAAAQNLALAIQLARSGALASGRAHGIVFDPGDELGWQAVVDGDGDGVRRDDVAAGVDLPLGGPQLLARHFPGVRAGLVAGVPTLRNGAAGEGGVAFGRSAVLSCSPGGGSSSGTLYLRDGDGNAAAIRLYGPTGRVTLWWHGVFDATWTQLD